MVSTTTVMFSISTYPHIMAGLSKPQQGSDQARLITALDGEVQNVHFTPAPEAHRRALLGFGYCALVATNVASGMGIFGPNNAEVSNAFPTAITPSGYAFAIWGVIFLLEGGGVAYLLCSASTGSVRAITFEAVNTPWFVMWACQNLWQLVFSRTPLTPNPSYLSIGQIFVPCAILLVSAWGAGLSSCRRLQASGVRSHAAGLLVALPSGINSGWLSAASCIGLALVGQSLAGSPEALNATGIPLILAGTATAGGLLALQQWGAGYVGLGYAGAVAWALRAIAVNTSNGVSTPEVRSTALAGVPFTRLALSLTIALPHPPGPDVAARRRAQLLCDAQTLPPSHSPSPFNPPIHTHTPLPDTRTHCPLPSPCANTGACLIGAGAAASIAWRLYKSARA